MGIHLASARFLDPLKLLWLCLLQNPGLQHHCYYKKHNWTRKNMGQKKIMLHQKADLISLLAQEVSKAVLIPNFFIFVGCWFLIFFFWGGGWWRWGRQRRSGEGNVSGHLQVSVLFDQSFSSSLELDLYPVLLKRSCPLTGGKNFSFLIWDQSALSLEMWRWVGDIILSYPDKINESMSMYLCELGAIMEQDPEV